MFPTKLLLKSVTKLATNREFLRHNSKYKAAVLKKLGGKLELDQLERQSLSKGQVRVKVEHCSVNSVDIRAFRDDRQKVPFVPGLEFTGEILEIGKGVPENDFVIGDRVAALNMKKFGGLAEECIVDAKDVWKVPSNLPLKDAAVILLGHSTALFTFGKLFPIKEHQTIVVTAATGGNGLAAVEIAAQIYHAKVIAVTDTETNSDVTRSKGAFSTLHFHKDLRADLNRSLNHEGADVIYDAVGDFMLQEIGKCVSLNGHIICASTRLGNILPTPPPHCFLTVVSLMALKEQNFKLYRQIVADTLEMAGEELISAHVSGRFFLDDVNDAIAHIDGKKCSGKVVVDLEVGFCKTLS